MASGAQATMPMASAEPITCLRVVAISFSSRVPTYASLMPGTVLLVTAGHNRGMLPAACQPVPELPTRRRLLAALVGMAAAGVQLAVLASPVQAWAAARGGGGLQGLDLERRVWERP